VAKWQLQEAKAKLSEVIDSAESSGPQVITRRGVEAAVVVPIEQWRKMQQKKRKRTLLEVLQSGPQFDLQIPPRGQWKMRKPVKF
jgi:antitoxin Phd